MAQREWLKIQIDSVITIQYHFQTIYRDISNDNSCHRHSLPKKKNQKNTSNNTPSMKTIKN